MNWTQRYGLITGNQLLRTPKKILSNAYTEITYIICLNLYNKSKTNVFRFSQIQICAKFGRYFFQCRKIG